MKLANKLMIGAISLASLVTAYYPTKSQEEQPKQASSIPAEKDQTWEELDSGLHLTRIIPETRSEYGDSIISILRVNPKNYSFKLLTASEYGSELTAKEWATEHNLTATINAGMFDEDRIRNVGYMKNYDHTNNPDFKVGYNSLLAFNPQDSNLPQLQILDTRCQDPSKLMAKYNSLSQSIRMIGCTRKNTWSQQPKRWSTCAIGTDIKGNALLIHSRSPYTVHDFIDTLLSSHIGIQNAMYLEGGPEASLYVNAGGREIELIGSYETEFNENDDNDQFWSLPNVIGIEKK